MSLDVSCPQCGEADDLRGRRSEDLIELECLRCTHRWERDPSPVCPTCGGRELLPAVLAVVERSRGTQLSVVGSKSIQLCYTCDPDTIERYERNRPNPLMPNELPTYGPEQLAED